MVNFNRPFTSVAHELGHALGRNHASPDCGGSKNAWDPWAPDEQGFIHGVGLDLRSSPFNVLAPAPGPSASPQYFDYMSYCAQDSSAWTSVEGWQFLVQRYHLGTIAAAAATAARGGPSTAPAAADPVGAYAAAVPRGQVRVSGFVSASGTHLTRIEPTVRRAPGSPSGSPYRVRVLGARHRPLKTVTMSRQQAHVNHGGSVTFIAANVPARGAESVEVLRGATGLARHSRPPHAPKARFISPRSGSRLGRGPRAVVRWSASNRDHKRLRVKLDFSADNGRHWLILYLGPNRRSLALPTSLLRVARRARLRLRISDGFNEITALSGRFTVVSSSNTKPPAAGRREP